MSAYFPPHFSTLHFWTALSRAFKSVTAPMQRKAFQFQLILPPHPQVFRPPAYLGHLENNFCCWRRKNTVQLFGWLGKCFGRMKWAHHVCLMIQDHTLYCTIHPDNNVSLKDISSSWYICRSPRGHCGHNCFDKLNSYTIIPFLPKDQNSRFMHTKRAKSSHSTCQAQHTHLNPWPHLRQA